MRIAVFGLGYVGLVTALCHAANGHHVVGVEKDTAKLDLLRSGMAPIREPGVEDLLGTALSAGALDLTDDPEVAVSATDLALVCVGTPSSILHGTDLTAVLSVTRQIANVLRGAQSRYAVIIRSTVPPGTMRDYVTPALTGASGRTLDSGLSLYFNPEFLRQGSAVADFHGPPFVVLGTHDGKPPPPTSTVCELHPSIGDDQVVLNFQEAELLKIACNAFHALKIDFANEIGTLARCFDADPARVMSAFAKDTKLNISTAYLRPGFPFGGSCLPKDVRSLNHLAGQHHLQLPVTQAILASNDAHLDRIANHLVAYCTGTIGMVGITFKANTDDLRESAAMRLIEKLRHARRHVIVHEPAIQVDSLIGVNLEYLRNVVPDYVTQLVDWPTLRERSSVILVTRSGVVGSEQIARCGKPVFDLDMLGMAPVIQA